MLRFLSVTVGLVATVGLIAEPQEGAASKDAVVGTQIIVRARNSYGKSLVVTSIATFGQRVKEGDLLVQLNTSHLDTAISERKTASHSAQATAEASKIDLRNAELRHHAHVASAQFQIELAELELTEFKEGILPVRRLAFGLEVLKAEQNLRTVKAVVKSGGAGDAALKAPTAELELAKLRQHRFKAYTARKELKKLEGAVAAAKRKSAVDRSVLASEVDKAKSSLARWQAIAHAETSRVDHLVKQLDLYRLRARMMVLWEQASRRLPRAVSFVKDRSC